VQALGLSALVHNIHVGVDEADKAKWKASPRIQARIKELGVADEHGLQGWFIRQMDKFLTSKGRRLVGWDEILEGGLAENAVVMSWRGVKGGITGGTRGARRRDGADDHTYLDYSQSKDQTKEPLAIGGFLPLETVYGYEPLPVLNYVADGNSCQKGKRIFGLVNDFIARHYVVDWCLWPGSDDPGHNFVVRPPIRYRIYGIVC